MQIDKIDSFLERNRNIICQDDNSKTIPKSKIMLTELFQDSYYM